MTARVVEQSRETCAASARELRRGLRKHRDLAEPRCVSAFPRGDKLRKAWATYLAIIIQRWLAHLKPPELEVMHYHCKAQSSAYCR